MFSYSLPESQNYSLWEFLIKSSEAPKSEKSATETTNNSKRKNIKKEINKSLKTIIDKLRASRFEPQGLRSAMVMANLKFYLQNF